MENYNIEEFENFISKNIDVPDIINYFNDMNNQYLELKEKDAITDDLMNNLTKFWIDVNDIYEDNIILILSSHWTEEPPEVIAAIVEYIPKYREIEYNKYIEKFDRIERKETDLLFNEIWDRNVRTEIEYSYLDYDEDIYYDKRLILPKNDRDDLEYEFRKELATVIYNRGTLFIRLFSGRGKFDIISITVNGDGVWKCLKKNEVEQEYDLQENERVIQFNCDHCLKRSKDSNVIYFDF